MDKVNKHKIVLLDDDFAIRHVVKIALARLEESLKQPIEVFTSDNGVEGLGYIYATNPEIIIIDTTLPKYSGKELIEFLFTNPRFNGSKTKIILLHEEQLSNEFDSYGYKLLSKKDPKFFDKLIQFIREFLQVREENTSLDKPVNLDSSIVIRLSKLILRLANKNDIINEELDKVGLIQKMKLRLLWLATEIGLGILLSVLKLFVTIKEDANIPEKHNTDDLFRSRYYPTFASSLVGLFIIFFQVFLFMIGGATILFLGKGISIQSVLADYSKIVNINLNELDYDSGQIVYENGSLKLKGYEIEQINQEEEQPEEEVIQEEVKEEPNVEEELDNNEEPQKDEQPLTQEEDQTLKQVQGEVGEETDNQQEELNEIPIDQQSPNVLGIDSITSIEYSKDHPVAELKEPIKFTKLIAIKENSNVNTFESSLDPSSKGKELLTYQLSPNGQDWFYFSSENKWEKTSNSWNSSNTIQTVNKYISQYDQQVNDSGSLYIRIYFNSNGTEKVELKELVVERELEVITIVDDKEEEKVPQPEIIELDPDKLPLSYPISYPVSSPISYTQDKPILSGPISYPVEPPKGLVVSGPVSYVAEKPKSPAINLPPPIILNAAYANGQKVISGRLEFPEGKVLTIPAEELGNYTVNIYYNSGEYIGNTNLHEIEKFGYKQYVFELKTPSRAGGYVVAKVEYKRGDSVIQSTLSDSLENSTFTVNETGDQADTSAGDGSCDYDNITPGSQCTLRAAIQEANALAGSDNIHFNIPTLDPGYRDYDDPNTPSSGDGSGGDDYWTINPSSTFANITDTVEIDGSTQTANVIDSNLNGPEIQISGASAGSVSGFTFNSGSNGSVVNSLVINGYNVLNRTAIQANTSGLTITRTYLGIDIRGITAKANHSAVIIANTATNINIGTSTSDGNVISGNTENAIRVNTGSGIVQTISIKGNYIGLNAAGTSRIGNNYGIRLVPSGLPLAGSQLEIGGTSQTHKNVISGNCEFGPIGTFLANIRIQLPNNGNMAVKVLNNFIGPDASGINVVGSVNACPGINIHGSAIVGADTPVQVGDMGMGNLFRHNTWNDVIVDNGSAAVTVRPVNIVGNSFGETANTNVSTINSSVAVNRSFNNNVNILNNHFGYTASDPNWGLALNPAKTGIAVWASNLTVQGNKMVNLQSRGIVMFPNVTPGSSNGTRLGTWYFVSSEIGGTNPLSGSLCGGTESNCISGSAQQGIYAFDVVPLNETTLFSDNVLTNNGPSGSLNIEQAWTGSIELFSGSNRRTDLTTDAVSLVVGGNSLMRYFSTDLNTITTLTNESSACVEAVDCPLTGHSIGVNGQSTFMLDSVSLFANMVTWPKFAEYTVDNAGTVTSRENIKLEQPHFASQNFSFDGDSTTDPVVTGGYRSIHSQDYYDLGEPWTDKPSQSRDVAGQNFGLFQIMEAQYVDANPIWNGSEYVITVDSTSDEDNVSLAGFDDGAGAYSGGGTNGANGLANGKTSLREAIIVANNHAGPETIKFNIPLTDPGYRDYDNQNTPSSGDSTDGDDYWTIRVATALPIITSEIHLNGDSQSINQGDRNIDGPEIEISGRDFVGSVNGIEIATTGTNSSIDNLMVNEFNTRHVWVKADNVTVSDSHIGIDAKALNEYFPKGYFSFRADNVNNLTVTNNYIASAGHTTLYIYCTSVKTGINISDNHIKINKLNQPFYTHINTTLIYDGDCGGVIDNNVFSGKTSWNTIAIQNVNDVPLTVSNNNFYELDPGNNDPHVYMWTNYLKGVEFINNSFSMANSSDIDNPGGVVFYSGENILFKDNSISESPFYAIQFISTINSIVEDNEIFDNHGYGILLNKWGGVDSTGITMQRNKMYGLTDGYYSTVPNGRHLHIAFNGSTKVPPGGSFYPTANDTADADIGHNQFQNYPLIKTPKYLGANQYQVTGYLDANIAEAPFTIEICKSDNHHSGHGGCLETLDTFTLNTPGNWARIVTVPGATGTDTFSALATNNLGSTSEFGTTFISDADPELINSEWVITVNSTTNEDNVSTLGFDDGSGIYSGGGLTGTNGAADGKTSLREAIIAANNHPGPDKIEFDIPTSDPGYINPDGSRTSTAEPAGTYPLTPNGYWRIDSTSTFNITGNDGLFIDGYSQTGAVRNTAGINSSLNATIVIQLNQPGANSFIINNSDNNHIAGLNIRATTATGNPRVNITNDSDNNWIEGNYFGSDINGNGDLTMWARLFVSGLSDNNVIGTNRDGNNDLGEKNLITGNNTAGVTGLITLGGSITNPSLNNIISGNYIGTDKTGKVCPGYNIQYSAIINYEFANNTQIGSNLDNNNDVEEGNIWGCVTTGHRGAIRQWGDGMILSYNYINVAPDGTSLAPFDDGTQRSGVSHMGEDGKYYFNTFKGYPSGSAFHFRDDFNRTFDGTELKNNKFIGPVTYGIQVGGGNIANIRNVLIEDNEISGATQNAILVESNAAEITIKKNKFIHSAAGAVINLMGGVENLNAITANDSGDVDTGSNDLQNYPVITKVEYIGGGQYKVYGDLDGSASEDPFSIEICESTNHLSGHGGCSQTLGFTTVNSPWVATVTFTGDSGDEGRIFTTLATNTNGSTSEFSENFVAAIGEPDYTILDYAVNLVSPINGVQIDDRTPLLKWETPNPEVDYFDIYLDGEFYKRVEGNITEYTVSQELDYGTHTWQVIAYRVGDEETGRSDVEDFVIVDPSPDAEIEFEAINPKDNIVLNSTTPKFEWMQISGVDEGELIFQLFIDGELVKELTETEYQLLQTEALTEGEHTWYVVIFEEQDGELVEIARTEEEKFTITLPDEQGKPIDTPVTGDIPSNRSNTLRLSTLLPIASLAIVAMWSLVSTLLVNMSNLSKLGLLFGILIPRKKKYWGIVFDVVNSEVIPFAVVRLYGKQEANKTLIAQTISDLKGRYGLLVDNLEKYYDLELEVQSEGYEHFTRQLDKKAVNSSYEFVEDIPLIRLGKKFNKYKQLVYYSKNNILNMLTKVALVLMLFGFVYTLIVSILSPHILNYVLLVIYGLLFILNLISFIMSRKSNGKVIDQSNEGIKGASVRIYDLKGTPLDVAMTNQRGEVKINIKPGDYHSLFYKAGYRLIENTEELVGKFRLLPVVINKAGKLNKDIFMKKTGEIADDNPFN